MKNTIRPIMLAVVLAMGVTVTLASGCLSAAPSKAVQVGEEVPGFTLKDVNGKEYTLKQFEGNIVVLDFCSQECPWSRGADPAVAKLVKDYKDKDVVVLGIDSHHATKPSQIKAYLEEKKLSFPVLKDVGNQYADKVGAKKTPEVYVVDAKGKLAYHGAVDNRSRPEGKPSKHHVRNALDALIAGEEVPVKTVKLWGCGIKRAG